MIRKNVLLAVVSPLIILGSTTVLACFSPNTGPEYDSQISVEPIEGIENTFRISAPILMNGNTLNISILKWMPHKAPPDGKQPYKKIHLVESDGTLTGQFSTPRRADAYEITVELWYGPAVKNWCPTGAEKVLDDLVE